LQNTEGDVVSFHVKATDSTSGATLTFSATGLPNGLSLSSSGLVSGTIAAGTGDAGGAFSPTVTVTDGTAVASEAFSWNVNSPITLVPIDALQNNEGDVVSFHIKASDSTSGATLTFTALGLPDGLSLSTSGLISGTILAGTADSGGAYSPVITVKKGLLLGSLLLSRILLATKDRLFWACRAELLVFNLVELGFPRVHPTTLSRTLNRS
jgi:hypothetical protein